MISVTDLGSSLRIATVVAPVAVYFLLLGLLNSRRHPQMLTGRQDFALMLLALSPVAVLPAMSLLGVSLYTITGTALALAAIIRWLGPAGHDWVVYNLSVPQAHRAVARALQEAGIDARRDGNRYQLEGPGRLDVSAFSLLRNVTIKVTGTSDETARDIADALASRIRRVEVQTPPMAVALLLVATAMLVVPVTLVAHRMPEIVRLLTDTLP